MITTINVVAAVTTPRKRADVYSSLGINGDANHPFGFISNAIGCMDIFKDVICLGYFFLGLHLVTFFRRKPSWFSFVLMVRTVGNS